MVRKKRGSSLITVVIISGILITVGTAMLSMTLGDYKMRITESTRIKNLYSSESGLDAAYDILIKTFDSAAEYGIKEVDDFKESLEFEKIAEEEKEQVIQLKSDIAALRKSEDKDKEIRNKNKQIDELNEIIKEKEDEAIDACFKGNFNDFVYMNEKKEDESQIDSSDNKDELRKSIMGKKYIVDIEKSKDEERYREITFNTDNEINLLVDKEIDGDNEGIEYDDIDADIEKGKKYPTRKYEIKITSRYVTEDTNGKTERKLQSIYDMTVPDYKDVVFIESNAELPKYTFLNDKAILIGGDMNVIDSNLSVKGDIFIEGIGKLTDSRDTRVYDKYNGGIVLDADSHRKIDVTGDVITGQTFNIRNNIRANIYGNLYAMNVYAGSEKVTDDLSHGSTLDVVSNGEDGGEVVVDNDITLKADDTNITIDKFYGINDKNIKYDETKTINYTGEPLGRTSSSIIVNGEEGSNIIINEEAYIMGVAHINTKNGYNTGESTGIKGNYIAYAVPSVDDNGNVDGTEEFEYDEPLQLLKEDNVIKKSEHFIDYWTPILSTIDTGGIQLPEGKTYSIGAIVYKGLDNNPKIAGSSYALDSIPAVVSGKQREFASKVYNVGGKTIIDKQVLYESLGSGKDRVSDLMDIGETLDDYKEKNKIFFTEYGDENEIPNEENNNEKAIFSNKNILIRESSEENITKDGDDILINVPKGNKLNAFIATLGNVTIEGEVNVQGTIIAKGNLAINETNSFEEKSISYNKELLDRIQASNVELFNSVFGHVRDENDEEEQEPVEDIPISLDIQYDANKFIKNKLWKIIK